uniref:Matrilin-like 40 kDa protein n=1 Tax=Ambigolimax valentianus TaxID=1338344 RepID=A6YM37_9EUPU|nr:matrilin-like 40 kDa protein [Ambigolimax valentianus]
MKTTALLTRNCAHTKMLVGLLLFVASVLVTGTNGQPVFGCLFANCQQNCRNKLLGHECYCNSGYTVDPNNYRKCIVARANCNSGFENVPGNPSRCQDIDECQRTNPCQQGCTNTVGGFQCFCFSGFRVDYLNSYRCIAERPTCEKGFQPSVSNPSICADINECETSHPCDQTCVNLHGSYRCTCRPGYEVNEYDNDRCNLIQECTTLADIVLVLDSSGSMEDKNNELQLNFASRFVSHFLVGNSKARFGALLFSDFVENLFYLNKYTSTADVSKAILRAPYHRGTTLTNEAFDFIRTEGVFSTPKGGRSNAPDIVVVFTDGQSTKPALTLAAADNLKRQNVRIVAVGIGNEVSKEELRQVASSRDDVFEASSFENLDYIEQKLAKNVCRG